MTDPKRLSDQADLPPQLKAALRIMGQSTTPPEIVERVQRSLAGLPTAGAAGGFPFGWGGAVSTVAVAVAVTTAAAWMRVQRDEARAVPMAAAVARSEPVEIVELEPKANSILMVVEPESIASPASPVPTQRGDSNASMLSAPVAQAPTPRQAAPHERITRHKAVSSSAEAPVVASKAQPTPVAAIPVEEVAELLEPNDAAPRPAVPQAPVPEDEASLVYRAKRLARTDRAAAWSLVESHARHFPNGELREEREVLAIDLLHGMGREQEAKQRAARFLSHFPKSGYRSVVERSVAGR